MKKEKTNLKFTKWSEIQNGNTITTRQENIRDDGYYDNNLLSGYVVKSNYYMY